MKIYCKDYNNVCTDVISVLTHMGWVTDNPQEADAVLLWQDVRGECLRLAHIFKDLGKKVFVIQHGRGGTRDYDKPNKFPLVADKMFVWGPLEKRRMQKLGYGDRVSVTGSPLVRRLRPKTPHGGFRVFFSPITMEHEEPENILVYAKLKEWESRMLQDSIKEKFPDLKRAWATKLIEFNTPADQELATKVGLENVPHNVNIVPSIPAFILQDKGLVVTSPKAGLHDVDVYKCEKVPVFNQRPEMVEQIIEILRQTDCVVTIEEGTLSILATAMNIPVIHMDIYKPTIYGGVEYKDVEWLKPHSSYRTDNLNELPNLLEYVRTNDKDNKFKRDLRIKTVEDELGPQYGDPIKNIVNEIELCLK